MEKSPLQALKKKEQASAWNCRLTHSCDDTVGQLKIMKNILNVIIILEFFDNPQNLHGITLVKLFGLMRDPL